MRTQHFTLIVHIYSATNVSTFVYISGVSRSRQSYPTIPLAAALLPLHHSNMNLPSFVTSNKTNIVYIVYYMLWHQICAMFTFYEPIADWLADMLWNGH